MKINSRSPVACALLLLAGAAPGAADEICPEPTEVPTVPQEVTQDLVAWIALHTMYDVTGLFHDPPAISFCKVGDWIDYEDQTLLVEPELNAAYNYAGRVIHLVEPWSPDDPYDRSVLLHEFIHVVQLANHDWPCTGAPELEAYMLQAEYLSDYGIDPGFDWRSIFLLSLCPEQSPGN